MVNFIMSKMHNSICFNSMPQRSEWQVVADVFDSTVEMDFYKNLLNELYEIKSGGRKALSVRTGLIPEEHTVPSRNPYCYIIMKAVNNRLHIEIEDLEQNQKIQIKVSLFIQIIENWIKFVEINTQAFADVVMEHY